MKLYLVVVSSRFWTAIYVRKDWSDKINTKKQYPILFLSFVSIKFLCVHVLFETKLNYWQIVEQEIIIGNKKYT